MSPRPRAASDDEMLDAVAHVVSRAGPRGATLAAVGAACGLSAAAVAQRFGSKRALMRAYGARREAAVRGAFGAARAAEPSPLQALVEALAAPVAATREPQALAYHLALAQMELSDAALHAHARAAASAAEEETAGMLEAAMSAGELVPCDTAGLARTVQTTCAGALATWTVFREGSVDDWLLGELEAVLAPYLPRAAPGESP